MSAGSREQGSTRMWDTASEAGEREAEAQELA